MEQVRWESGKQIWFLILLLSAAALAGFFLGITGWLLFVTLLGYLVWHARQFMRLYIWLAGGRKQPVPEGRGPWYFLNSQLNSWRKDYRRSRKGLMAVINEIRTSTEALNDAVVLTDTQGAILWCNTAAKKMLGLDRSMDVGTRLRYLIRHPDFIAYLNGRDFSQPLELVSPVSDEHFLSIQITPYLHGQKLFIARDVTELRRLEQVRRDFVSNVSHELRTPLTVLGGYLEMLQAGAKFDPEQFRDMVGQMSSQTSRMQNIVEELLYLARLEQGTGKKPQQACDVGALVAQIKQEAVALSGNKAHRIELLLETTRGLYAQPDELHRIFSNLVFNAVRYTPASSQIKICWRIQNKGLEFSVTDNGDGIAAKDIPRLTERFYRVDTGRTRDQGGTGLGLSIVKHTLTRYGSVLQVSSRIGQGSCFSCHFGEHWVA